MKRKNNLILTFLLLAVMVLGTTACQQTSGKGNETGLALIADGKANMEIVYADAIHKNRRSQHVMEKVGFCKIGVDDQFIYYQCEKRRWKHP